MHTYIDRIQMFFSDWCSFKISSVETKKNKTKQNNNNNNNNKQKKKHHGAHIFHLSSHQGFFERSDIRDIQDKVTVIH